MTVATQVHSGAFVDPAAQLGIGVTVGPGAVIGPHVTIGDGTTIGSHALLAGWTTIGRECRIHHGAVLGSAPQDLKYKGERSYLVVGDQTECREYMTANLATEPEATTRIGSHCLLMAYSHVAHNCQLGDHVIVANAVQFAGYVLIEDWAIVGGGSVVHQFVRIGTHCMIGGGSRISQDVAPFVKVAGNPPRMAGLNSIGLERRAVSAASIQALEKAYRLLFRRGLTAAQAVAQMRGELGEIAEIERLAHFVETSARGITR
ncbi:MAG: acyl-ACP--UDP-N-acetylglucosamine O-acyltransferase [Candidatus Eisenbacteria bacterium]|uniref:Acyl-ACP--UDP-N-acetylglucosamine O-acyltransferase n=1 Tax=Eiseniibacteriota bacterium TaxID=2212470 RepID=A0A849SHB6_UNCEI|nr:acyl-ACP--UDP-N-acetylglucosamine O-acyltransferase [Candidatus Eisenbacteria bacterium]